MKTATERIESNLRTINNDIIDCREKLKSNFMYHFEWGYTESLYSLLYTQKVYGNILTELDSSESPAEIIEYHVTNITKTLLNGGFTSTSSSS